MTSQNDLIDVLTSMRNILDAKLAEKRADIRYGTDVNPSSIQRVTVDLTTARNEGNAFKLGFPFNSFHVEAASDTDTNVKLSLNSDSSIQIQNYKLLTLNDGAKLDRVASSGYLTWDAQSGKSMTIVFFVDVEFRSGKNLDLNAGGISISDGSAFEINQVTLTGGAATQVMAQDSTRKVGTFRNTTGATVWAGGSTVTNSGATTGLQILPGDLFEWRNTAALYLYAVSGATIEVLEES